MKSFFTSSAFRFCMAVNCVVVSFYFATDLFRSSPFADVDDWGLFLLFMLSLGRGPA